MADELLVRAADNVNEPRGDGPAGATAADGAAAGEVAAGACAGIPLEQFLRENAVGMPGFLPLALGLTRHFVTLHQRKVVYQHCNPYNLFIQPNTGETTLLQAPRVENLYTPGATLGVKIVAYIAPEQTGRISQGIDHRTDLYSLGVLFYEMLTGRKPFASQCPLEMIHWHIARAPVTPAALDPRIPGTVSALVVKLLEKNVDARYQTAFSLQHDLEECRRQLAETGTIAAFPLAQHDLLGNFKIPQQLYGREKELALLTRTIGRITTGAAELVLVAGTPGVGKSALVQAFRQSVTEAGGFFIKGKYNQLQQNTPYNAFIQAVEELVSQLVTLNGTTLEAWQTALLEALGKNGKVLTDAFPALEKLLGEQPEVLPLEPNENQNRFGYLFRRVIKTVASARHPLVMVMDDLQWADVSSLQLFRSLLLDQEIKHCLLVGTYRSNEIGGQHPLAALFSELPKIAPLTQEISLRNLTYRHVNELISHTLHSSSLQTIPLTNLIYHKTQGNALFLKEFLQALYKENLLTYSYATRKWQWEVEKIRQLNVTENILDLLASKIQKLPAATQRVLTLAACLGNQFAVKLLAIVAEQPLPRTLGDLQPALIEGLVTPVEGSYAFAHDRIQQAVYSLIPPADQPERHQEIGMRLLRAIPAEEQSQYVFEIANQFNACIERIGAGAGTLPEEIAGFYCQAGANAKAKAAYKSAKDYFHNGILLLPGNGWQADYALSLTLYVQTAECSYLCGDFELMEACIGVVLREAHTLLDKVKVYETRIRAYTAQSRLEEAMRTALEMLELLDVRFPRNPNKWHVLLALAKNQLHLAGRPVEYLLSHPAMHDPLREAAVRILSSVSSTTYFAYPNYFPLFICKAFGLILRHGNTSHSSIVSAGYSAIISAGMGDLDTGYRLAQVAVQLLDKFPTEHLRARTMLVANAFHIPGKAQLKSTLPALLEAVKQAQLSGDYEYAAYAALAYGYTQFMCGKPLGELLAELKHHNQLIGQLNQELALGQNAILAQTVFNLLEAGEEPTRLRGEFLDEVKMQHIFTSRKSELAIFELHLCKMILFYLFGQYQAAAASAAEAEAYLKSSIGNTLTPMYYLYDALAHLALAAGAQGETHKRHLQKAAVSRKKMLKFVKTSPANYLHKLHLIDAEFYRAKGDSVKAPYYYQQAITAAKDNDFIQEEALAYELAGKFYLAQRNTDFAAFHLGKAYRVYQAWGARSKMRELSAQYGHVFTETAPNAAPEVVHKPVAVPESPVPEVPKAEAGPAAQNSLTDVDVTSILKVVKALASEVAFEKLQGKLLEIAIENTGAQQGYLVVEREGGLFVSASGGTGVARTSSGLQPVGPQGPLPAGVLQYVAFTGQPLVLEQACRDERFGQDPLVQSRRLQSVFCLPILHQDRLLALLYFENNLTPGAFREEHVEFLKFLSDKIASLLEKEVLLKQLHAHQQETLQAVLNTQEDERRRIAEDLHDGLGYMLSTLKLNLVSLQDLGPEAANQSFLDNALRLLEESFKELRSVAHQLMPDSLFVHGLPAAVGELAQRVSRSGKLQVQFASYNAPGGVTPAFDMELYRVVQELVNNVVKHAQATQLELQLVYHADVLILTAEDDGRGFDYGRQLAAGTGKGLRNIANRVAYLQGQLHFDARPGRGTSVAIHLPFPPRPSKKTEN